MNWLPWDDILGRVDDLMAGFVGLVSARHATNCVSVDRERDTNQIEISQISALRSAKNAVNISIGRSKNLFQTVNKLHDYENSSLKWERSKSAMHPSRDQLDTFVSPMAEKDKTKHKGNI